MAKGFDRSQEHVAQHTVFAVDAPGLRLGRSAVWQTGLKGREGFCFVEGHQGSPQCNRPGQDPAVSVSSAARLGAGV